MKEVTKESFEEDVLRAKRPVLVDFWGPQCAPCLALMPVMEELEHQYEGQIEMVKVEAPKNRRLCLQLQVLSLPTFVIFKDGQEVDRLAGNITIPLVKESIQKLVGQIAD